MDSVNAAMSSKDEDDPALPHLRDAISRLRFEAGCVTPRARRVGAGASGAPDQPGGGEPQWQECAC